MAQTLLIITPHVSFGSMLRLSLEETKRYRVFTADTEQSALAQYKPGDCDVTFLDVDLGADEVLKIGTAIRARDSKAELIIISDEDPPSSLYEIRPWRLLRKPFYLPELMSMLGTEPGDESPRPGGEDSPNAPTRSTDLAWLQDVNKAAQRLTRLTLESSAQAALITRGNSLWAYAGGLSQETADELVHIVSRSSDEQKGGDILRFVRLETTRAEHMLYVTSLASDVILALVFDAETPFSTIRAQANQLARSMEVEKTGAVTPPATPPPSEASARTDESAEGDLPAISEIISDVPAPIPAHSPKNPVPPAFIPKPVMSEETVRTSETDAKKTRVDQSMLETRVSAPLSDAHVIKRESITAHDSNVAKTVRRELPELDLTLPARTKRPVTPVRPPKPGEMDETRPHLDAEVVGIMGMEPASPALYKLNYACLLVPRIKTHYLTGDVAAELGEFLPNICIAFGWRLEFMAVRPEYMQWVVSVPPNTAPGHVMRVIREQTSGKLFKEFPQMKKENPSGDFWAPGYLIMGGSQPHPQQLVKDYIKQTRDRQGSFHTP